MKAFSALLLCIFALNLSAQTILTAPGLASFKKKVASGGGGCSPSYANTGGTGNRTSIITVTCGSDFGTFLNGAGSTLVDGDTVSTGRNFFNSLGLDPSYHEFLRFDFSSAVLITEAKFYQQTSTDQGVWQWQGSNDASSWTNIGGTFSLVTATTTTLTTLAGNSTSYRYYQLSGVSGTMSNGPYIFQFEFKICGL